MRAFSIQTRFAGRAAVASLWVMACALSGPAQARELASAPGTQTVQDEIGVTRYMSCAAFQSLMSEDHQRAVRSQSTRSNSVLERHVVQMMQLLQPYAITGPDGQPLDFVWGFLVDSVGKSCDKSPSESLNDAIMKSGEELRGYVQKAQQDTQRKMAAAEKAHPTEDAAGDDEAPPAGIPDEQNEQTSEKKGTGHDRR